MGECFGWGGSRGWGSCEAGWTDVGGSAGALVASVCPGVVGVAHSHMLRIGGNRGIMRNSTISSERGPAPMCADPLTAHGSETATHHDHQKIPSFQQKPAPSRRGPSLPCATPTINTPTRHTRHAPHRDRPTSGSRSVRLSLTKPTSRHARRARERKPYATPQNHRRAADLRNRTDLDAECDRSRHGLRPISMRSATDLDAELDRSRRGERPARFRPAIAPAQPGRPDVEARTTSSGAKATCRTSEPSASSRSAAARPISRMGT